jgi:hypothetical protein|uniref:Uncharacterized protein orf127 n=1 Tax=Vermamoeba vermiformis TaxID=5778 RepID=D4PBL1_VERVE|nr:hypothetical protein HaveOM_p28 [Vermamoeba vermiformis]ADD62223.1 hypothetical protein [Vermamoeba vermiformis]
MFSKVYSPHIFVYKPQTNSVFSLFLRFILLAVFVNFIFSLFSLNFLNYIIFNYFLDITFISELIVVFYVVSYLGEDLIDFDDVNVNFLDIDLVIFFKFFLNFSLLLVTFLFCFTFSKFVFWTALIVV